MVKARADLHTHSSASDGSDSPTELARKADELGLGGVALTDHDSLDGIREFMDADVSDELIRVPGLGALGLKTTQRQTGVSQKGKT
jgi:predicted metal-dependent phosphoesterase TrpH